MKRILLLSLILISLFISNQVAAQPIRNWTTYFGDNLTNVSSIQYDSVGQCIYTAGVSGDTTGIATSGSYKDYYRPTFYLSGQTPQQYDGAAFLSKWDLNGNLIWSTYYGGAGIEYAPRIKTDHSGNVYLMGYTESDTGIASNGAFMTNFAVSSFYLAKFSPQGQRLWATYLCHSDSVYTDTMNYGLGLVNNTPVFDLDIDSSNHLYVTFPVSYTKPIGTLGVYKQFKNPIGETTYGSYTFYSPFDIALLKFDSSGNKLWGTYYGGDGDEIQATVLCSKDGGVYLSGVTQSDTGIATSGVYQTAFNTGGPNSFLAKFDANGQRIWGTYMGGNALIWARKIIEDKQGNIYVNGITHSSSDISTPGTYQTQLNGTSNWFLMKFNNQGQKIWGTYLGKSNITAMNSFYFVNQAKNASIIYLPQENALYVEGQTIDSTDFDTPCGYPVAYQNKGFLAKMDTTGNLIWASHYDAAINDITIVPKNDGKNEIYFTSETIQDSLATPGAYKTIKTPYFNGLIGKMIEDYDCGTDTLTLTYETGLLKTDSNYTTYLWYHNGVLISTTTTPQLSITDTTGTYFVMTKQCICKYTSNTIQFSVTGIATNDPSSYLTIYPNPANTQVQIDINLPGNWNMEIYATDGKRMEQRTKIAGKYKLYISSYPEGIYLLRLNNGKELATKKFVVSRK